MTENTYVTKLKLQADILEKQDFISLHLYILICWELIMCDIL